MAYDFQNSFNELSNETELSDLKKDVSKLKHENPIIDTKEEIDQLKKMTSRSKKILNKNKKS